MSMVKLVIIHGEVRGKILDLAILAARSRSHCTSASNWES